MRDAQKTSGANKLFQVQGNQPSVSLIIARVVQASDRSTWAQRHEQDGLRRSLGFW